MALASALGALVLAAPAQAVTSYGALSNFDVFNDTGEPAHGFEIELDGISSSDVLYWFGAPNERYGDPTVVDFPGGVYVRYQSPYDTATQTFVESTALAPNPITPTDGHSCFVGAIGDYQNSGCEHFGVGLAKDPTNTVYRWLVADPAVPGRLQPAGTKVSIPAPTYTVTPPPPGAPNQQPIVQAVVQAPAPDQYDFGDAIWVKVYKSESPDPVELDHLVTDDPAVPQDAAEIETEWFLLQAEVGGANPAAELASEAQLGEGNESVTRRYEIYAYSGVYDPESHEARPVSDQAPEGGDLGNYLGAQMAAVNINQPPPPPPALVFAGSPLAGGEVGVPYSAPLVSGGVGAYGITVTTGALPGGLSTGTDGLLTGTPTAAGDFSFSVDVTDQAPQTASGSFQVAIVPRVAVTTTTLPTAKTKRSYSATLTAAGGRAPYTWALTGGSLPAGLSLDPVTGTVAGTPTKKAKQTLLTFQVTDALGATASSALTLTVK